MESKDCTSSGPTKPTPALHTANIDDKAVDTNGTVTQEKLTREHTQNVHSFLHDPVLCIQDGLHAGHIHLENVQGVLVQAFHTL